MGCQNSISKERQIGHVHRHLQFAAELGCQGYILVREAQRKGGRVVFVRQELVGQPVANLGVSGYGSLQELKVLEKYAVPLGPKMVAWFFFEGNDLEKVLRRVARIILDAALNPNALALHRIIVAEATRFPELAMIVSQQTGSHEAVERIGALLEREACAGRVFVRDFAFASAQFL